MILLVPLLFCLISFSAVLAFQFFLQLSECAFCGVSAYIHVYVLFSGCFVYVLSVLFLFLESLSSWLVHESLLLQSREQGVLLG